MIEATETREEIEDLLSGADPIARGNAASPAEQPARTAQAHVTSADAYQFGASSNIQNDKFPALEAVAVQVARRLAPALTAIAKRNVEVSFESASVTQYQQYRELAKQPEYSGIVSLSPLQGRGHIGIASSLVLTLVDLLFGGDARYPSSIEDRSYSPTECRIAERILNGMTANLNESMSELLAVDFQLLSHGAQIPEDYALPDDVCVTIDFQARYDKDSHPIRVCLPYLSIEPIRRRLQATTPVRQPLNHERWMDLLLDQLKAAEVELVAELGTATTTLAALSALKVGDIIDLPLQQSLTARIAQVPVLRCGYGVSNGHYAIRIHDFTLTSDSIQPSLSA